MDLGFIVLSDLTTTKIDKISLYHTEYKGKHKFQNTKRFKKNSCFTVGYIPEKARGYASLYSFSLVVYPIEKPSAESTAVSVVRAMLMITDHLFFFSFVITISSE